MTVLVDSDVLILIEVSRARDSVIVAKWMELSESDALILFSPVSAAELWAGARPAEYPKLEALFDALVCVPAKHRLAVGQGNTCAATERATRSN